MKKSLPLSKPALTGLLWAVAALTAAPAQADLVANGGFESLSGATWPGTLPADWNYTPVTGTNALLSVVTTTATAPNSTPLGFNADCCNGYPTLGTNPGQSPNGGNFFLMDADPNFAVKLWQTVSGLTVGDTYNVSFYQAAGAQLGGEADVAYSDWTSQQVHWTVALGGIIQQSATMTVDPATSPITIPFDLAYTTVAAVTTPWQKQILTFKATAVSEILSFMGSGPQGLPPFALLDGVSVTASVPEPETYALMGIGLLAFALSRRRHKEHC